MLTCIWAAVCCKQDIILGEFNKNDDILSDSIHIGDMMTFSPETPNSENVTITGFDTSNSAISGQLLITFEPALGNVHSTGAVVFVRGIPFTPTQTTSTTTTTDAPQEPEPEPEPDPEPEPEPEPEPGEFVLHIFLLTALCQRCLSC
jgi:hypothetical protein